MRFILFLVLLLVPTAVLAGILPPCTATGNCGFCDAMYTVNEIMRWVVSVTGAAALLFFIYAGFLFVAYGGVAEKVTSAKRILRNTIVGAVIVFVAWSGVNLIITTLTGTDNKVIYTGEQRLEWYNLCKNVNPSQECLGKGDGYPCNGLSGHCEKGSCEPGQACTWLGNQEGYSGYACRTLSKCGIRSLSECDTAGNCIRNMCTGNNVCCWLKSSN